MSPTEAAAKLQHFNDWRRDFEDKFEQPDAREISEAIDAAIEMIDRLEAAEKERDECNSRRLEAADHFAAQTALMKEKCDALRTALEKIADWDSAWGPYPETNEAWRAMVIVTAREAVPRRGEKK